MYTKHHYSYLLLLVFCLYGILQIARAKGKYGTKMRTKHHHVFRLLCKLFNALNEKTNNEIDTRY